MYFYTTGLGLLVKLFGSNSKNSMARALTVLLLNSEVKLESDFCFKLSALMLSTCDDDCSRLDLVWSRTGVADSVRAALLQTR